MGQARRIQICVVLDNIIPSAGCGASRSRSASRLRAISANRSYPAISVATRLREFAATNAVKNRLEGSSNRPLRALGASSVCRYRRIASTPWFATASANLAVKLRAAGFPLTNASRAADRMPEVSLDPVIRI
jgi:hypothetical protein